MDFWRISELPHPTLSLVKGEGAMPQALYRTRTAAQAKKTGWHYLELSALPGTYLFNSIFVIRPYWLHSETMMFPDRSNEISVGSC